MDFKPLAAATLIAALPAGSLAAQDSAPPAAAAPAAACSSFRFETVVVIDAASKRGSRIQLCANPGASPADWVKTLEDAIAQVRAGTMPDFAKADLIGQLENEIARHRPAPALATGGEAWATPAAPAGAVTLGKDQLGGSGAARPEAPFAVSSLPSLERPKVDPKAPVEKPKPMVATVKCLAAGERGAGMTCDYFQKGTVLALRAVRGLEDGAVVRFLRRGEEKGEVDLDPLAPGRIAQVALPAEVCKGVATSKVEIALLPPRKSKAYARGPAGRIGPFGLRC